MFPTITKTYAIGYMVSTYSYAGGDRECDIQADIALFVDKLDAERFLAESGGTRNDPKWKHTGWRLSPYVTADIRRVEILKK